MARTTGELMPRPGLTPKQRALIAEVKGLMSSLYLNPDELATLEDSSERTTRLELAKDQIIRSTIVLDYVLMDEFLSAIMCWHFFGKKRGFIKLWKTKRFKVFNYQLLEKMYLVQKLDFVKAIHDIPRSVSSELMALNDLRNAVAHSFFPQNRRRKPEWKDKNVFEKEGFEKFQEDMMGLKEFFFEHFWRVSPEDIRGSPELTAPDLPAAEPTGSSA
jgi:hypothetical protein